MSFSFDDYVAVAARKSKNRKPYVLSFKDADEPDIVIPYPDAVKQMDYEEAASAKQQLQILMRPGDYLRLREKLRGQDVLVAQQIVKDIWLGWGDDSAEVPGGKADSGA